MAWVRQSIARSRLISSARSLKGGAGVAAACLDRALGIELLRFFGAERPEQVGRRKLGKGFGAGRRMPPAAVSPRGVGARRPQPGWLR